MVKDFIQKVVPKKDWDKCEKKIVKFKKTFRRCPMCLNLTEQQDDSMGTVYAFCSNCDIHIEMDYV